MGDKEQFWHGVIIQKKIANLDKSIETMVRVTLKIFELGIAKDFNRKF